MENEFDDIEKIFLKHQESFTIYVVEKSFAIKRGKKYFKSFRGEKNFFSTDSAIKQYLSKIVNWIGKNCPDLVNLVQHLLQHKKGAALNDIITIMSQTFTTYSHQAVGPDVIDPIIIEEGEISQKHLTQLISLHEYSLLQPTIIIILKDDDFERAKALLKYCPNGINVVMIKNDGTEYIYKIINCGAEDVDTFIDLYTRQCFSTCSHTKRNVILNDAWSENSLVNQFSPLMFQIRSNLLRDKKMDSTSDLNEIINTFDGKNIVSEDEPELLKSFLCLAKLNRVFCNDYGGQDIIDAYNLAKDMNNDVLLAHVYRYADFFSDITMDRQKELLKFAKEIFVQNKMIDHAIYCENNELVLQLYSDKIDEIHFKELADKAVTDVHGLVGTSHIFNNTGVAYLLMGNPEKAISYFQKGLLYAKQEDRKLQRLAIQVNILIARSYLCDLIDKNDIIVNMRQIFDSMGINELPYLTSNFVMNLCSLAIRISSTFYRELLEEFPVKKLINHALQTNIMCSGQLVLQMQVLANKYSAFTLLDGIQIPSHISQITGKRRTFIERYNLNPFVFNVWI